MSLCLIRVMCQDIHRVRERESERFCLTVGAHVFLTKLGLHLLSHVTLVAYLLDNVDHPINVWTGLRALLPQRIYRSAVRIQRYDSMREKCGEIQMRIFLFYYTLLCPRSDVHQVETRCLEMHCKERRLYRCRDSVEESS